MPDPSDESKPQTEPKHFACVDALRGFAIMGVILFHCATILPAVNSRVEVIAAAGMYGVQLFFVVSAFTLFWSLRTRIHMDRKPLHAFYVRRVFRIGPLFWIAAVFYATRPGAWSRINFADIFTTAFFIHGWYPTTINSIVPGGWSIAAEFMFYLSIPILFRQVKSLHTALWLVLISTWFCALFSPLAQLVLVRRFPADLSSTVNSFIYFSFPSQLPVFCCGMVLYFMVVRSVGAHEKQGASPLIWVATAITFIVSAIPGHVEYAGIFVVLAYGLLLKPVPLLVNKVTRFVGTVSFSAYIWHFWVLEHIAPWVTGRIHPQSLSPRLCGTIQFAVVFPLTLTATLLVAAISYYLIESPGQQLGKIVIQSFNWGGAKNPSPSFQTVKSG